MNAYLVSHNGMGDNLFMIGALHFLLKFYEKIYFLCKSKYYQNINLFFMETPNIICIQFNEHNETDEIKKIIKANYETNDILICGFCHTSYLKSKITNTDLVNYTHIDKRYTIAFDTLTTGNYRFIADFSRDINLNLTYFYDYFYMPTTKESIELYKKVQDYYIIFIQLKSSDGKELNIKSLLEKHLHDVNTILLCNDKNVYDIPADEKTTDTNIKYNICKNFMYNKLVHYKEVIQNSDEIYIIDSCFIGIVLPYLKTNQLKAKKVRIIRRDIVDRIKL
jgi:hypothetical protein